MICQNCQMEIPDSLEFCPFCGEKIVEVQSTITEQETPRTLEKILVVEEERADSTIDAVDIDEEIERANAPRVYKNEAHKWNERTRLYSQEMRDKEHAARGHRDPLSERYDEADKPLDQILAQKVANGEMSVQNMMSMLAVLNGENPVDRNEPEEAPVSSEAKEPEKKGIFWKKEKTKEQLAAEELQKEDFYKNTQPLIDDPLPPSPWIKVVKIVLLLILIAIIILGAIYYL